MRRVYELHEHARSLEHALHETTALSEELQSSIEAEQKLIADLIKEAADAKQITDLTNDQVQAITIHMDRAQRRSTLKERRIDIAVAICSLAAGYCLNLMTPDKLGQPQSCSVCAPWEVGR